MNEEKDTKTETNNQSTGYNYKTYHQLTPESTTETSKIHSPMTGALSVLSYPPMPLHIQNIRRFWILT